jgi:hypothetical protein
METRKRMGRPPGTAKPAVLTARLDMFVTPEMKGWVLDHGGAEYIRRLVQADIDENHATVDAQIAGYVAERDRKRTEQEAEEARKREEFEAEQDRQIGEHRRSKQI